MNKFSFFSFPVVSREYALRLYLLLTVLVMILEFEYGLLCNSLGLVADSFHMLLDGLSILVGFLATFYARKEPNASNCFGYSRYEVLGGFVNGILLFFVAFYIVLEASVRICSRAEVEGDYLFSVSFIGLLLNVVGVLCFHDSVFHSDCGHSDHNLRGIYLHILADLLGSICVLISSVAVSYGYWFTDPLFSVFCSLLVFLSAISLVCDSGKVLLLCSDETTDEVGISVADDIKKLNECDILGFPQIWVHATAPNEFIFSTVAVKLNDTTCYSKMKSKIVEIFQHRLNDSFKSNSRIIVHLEL